MKVFFALFVLLPAAVLSQITDPELDDLWEGCKTKHEKVYDRRGTEVHRRIIWERNFRRVIYHNHEADKGLQTFWLGINEYADMDNREFVKMMNGLMPLNIRHKPNLNFDDDDDTDVNDLPKEVDWRNESYVTEVKNQVSNAQQGESWALSATGSMEGQHFNKTGELISLSEQELIDCCINYRNKGCNGGVMDSPFECITTLGGMMSEADYPDETQDDDCRFNKSKAVVTCIGYVDVKSGSEKALQKVVANVGPISVAIDARHYSFQLYSHGIYKIDNCSHTRLNHAVLVVGYGSDNGDDYWLVKNSWGKQWGMDGYIKMARNYNNMCGIATQASYPLV